MKRTETAQSAPKVEEAVSRLRASLAEAGAVLERPRPSKSELFNLEIPLAFGESRLLLLAQVKSTGAPVHIREALSRMRAAEASDRVRPLFICPFLGPRGRELCRESGVGYADAAGNCYLSVPGLLVSKTVDENPAAETVPIRKLFSPRASRIARALLEEPERPWTQLELSQAVEISLGHANNVVRRLIEQDYVRLVGKKIVLPDAPRLLKDWRAAYDFRKHEARHYFTLENFTDFERRLAEVASKTESPYALTAFAGAVHRVPHVRFNRFHFYYSGDPAEILRALDLKEVPTGANVILLRPADEGVYYRAREEDALRIACDVQLYLDLLSVGERSEEQAEALLEQKMPLLAEPRSDSDSEAAFARFLEHRDRAREMESAERYDAACSAYEQALAILGKVNHQDVTREKEQMRLFQWLSALEAGLGRNSREYFDLARSLYPSVRVAEKSAKGLGFNTGHVKLALLVYHLLAARFARTKEERTRAVREATNYYTVVKSKYTEDHVRFAPRADRAWKKAKSWLGGLLG